MKKLAMLVLLFSVLFIAACGSNGVNGSGKVTELNLEEIETFMNDKDTGFIYVKSALNKDSEDDENSIKEIESVSEEQKIDLYIFDSKELPESQYRERDSSKKIVKQTLGTFAFYKEGNLISEIDLTDVPEENLTKEIEKFIQTAKEK